MKKPLSALLLIVILVSLMSCSVPGADATGELITENTTTAPATGSEGMKAFFGAEKLWNLDLGEGYTHTDSECRVIRYNGSVNLRFTISPMVSTQPLPADAKPIDANNIKFFLWEGSEAAKYMKNIYWERDGLAFKIKATSTDQSKLTDDIVSPELAEILTKDPLANISGFTIQDYAWSTRMKNGDKSFLILLSHHLTGEIPQFSNGRQPYKNFMEAEGIEYYYQDDPATNSNRMMCWASDLGLFYLDGLVHSKDKGAVEYYNHDLIKRITAKMGATILQAKPTKKPIKADTTPVLKLWLTDFGMGFECKSVSRTMYWADTDENFNSASVGFSADIGDTYIPNTKPSSHPEILTQNGMEYSVYETLNTGDYHREIYWADEGVSYQLVAATNVAARKETIAIASPETAEMLTKNSDAKVAGFEPERGMYEAHYSFSPADQRGTIKMNLILYSPEQAKTIMKISNFSDHKEKQDGDLSYLIKAQENGGALVWNTDLGLFHVRISSSSTSKMEKKDFEFINSSLIKTINELLGAKPLPFPVQS